MDIVNIAIASSRKASGDDKLITIRYPASIPCICQIKLKSGNFELIQMRHQIKNCCERISSVAALAVMTLFTLYSTSPERSLCSQIVFSQDSPATTLAEPAVLLQMFRKDGTNAFENYLSPKSSPGTP